MKSIILLRHAKSSWAEAGVSDYDRPLNDRGKHDAPRAGEVLAERGVQPDLVLSSSAKRARKTAKKMVAGGGFDAELRLLDQFYLAAPKEYVAELQRLPDDIQRVVVVGHNPGIEDLLQSLTGRQQHMPTAAIAQVDVPIAAWSELKLDVPGRLIWFWTPAKEE